jgi:hypothetical protein
VKVPIQVIGISFGGFPFLSFGILLWLNDPEQDEALRLVGWITFSHIFANRKVKAFWFLMHITPTPSTSSSFLPFVFCLFI